MKAGWNATVGLTIARVVFEPPRAAPRWMQTPHNPLLDTLQPYPFERLRALTKEIGRAHV